MPPTARAAQMRPLDEQTLSLHGLSAPKDDGDTDAARWPDATECDKLAAHPHDRDRRAPGIAFAAINAEAAIAACEVALTANPDEARLRYQLGRALDKAERFADALAANRLAADAGYAMAFRSLALMYQHGRGVTTDSMVATSLYRQAIDAGDLGSANTIASMLWNGEGGEPDKARAVAR